MFGNIKERMVDIREDLGYQLFAIKVGFLARNNVNVFLELREHQRFEAEQAGEDLRLGERIGIMLLRKQDRGLVLEEVAEGLAICYENRRKRAEQYALGDRSFSRDVERLLKGEINV